MSLVTTLPQASKRTARRQTVTQYLLDTLRLWRRRARERNELARFSLRELRDIGLSASDAQREINKPVWRA